MRTVAVHLAALLLCLALTGCGTGTDDRPDVVLIVIDTLRADHLACYGYGTETAPWLSALAERGVVCRQVHATSSWTAPSTASLLTSLEPAQHGVISGFRAVAVRRQQSADIHLNRVADEVETLAETLRQAGYATFAVTDNHNVCDEMGFAQGFDRFQNYMYESAETVNATVLGWATEIDAAQPYFLYLHYMDPHRPYQQRPPLFRPGERQVDTWLSAYDSEIHYCDGMIARLADRFGWDDDTLLIVTSDHGEEFLDHGGFDHGKTLYGEVLDVPLVFAFPDGRPGPDHVDRRCSLLDVTPTILAALGIEAPRDTEDRPVYRGHDLMPLLRGETTAEPARPFFSDLLSAPWFGERRLESLILDDLKLIVTLPDTVELFDLAADPGERRNVSADRRADVLRLWEYMDRARSAWPRYTDQGVEATLDAEAIEKLKSLGYVR